jgi:hypothetical protein
MRKITVFVVPLLLLWSSLASAATIQVGSLVNNDFIDWSQLAGMGAEATDLGSSLPVTTNLGRSATASGTDQMQWYQEGSLWLGDFAPGSYLVSQNAQSLMIDFATAVAGIGAQLQSTAFGDFTAQLDLYNPASVLIGSFSVKSNNAGAEDNSNPFLGARSTGTDIARAIFTITADTADFGLGVGEVKLSDTPAVAPEPATLSLLALGGILAVRRRRASAER